ncbi:hypothetical protein BZM27_53455, partial [Paraburkholderia steynii]
QGLLVPLSDNSSGNSVKYESPNIGNLKLMALISSDGVAGNFRSGRVLEIGGEFATSRLTIDALYHKANSSVIGATNLEIYSRTTGLIDVARTLGPMTILAGAERQTGDYPSSKTVIWGGARYQASPAILVEMGAYQTLSR